MEKGKMPEESLHIIRQELITVTERIDALCCIERDLQDLKLEIKGLKLFLGKAFPEFKDQFPGIMKKLSKRA